jgi:hypothetical protein
MGLRHKKYLIRIISLIPNVGVGQGGYNVKAL